MMLERFKIHNRALVKAVREGNQALAEALLDHGKANVHVAGDLPLRTSARKGHKEIVAMLLAKGADLTARNHQAVYLAEKYGHRDVVEILRALPFRLVPSPPFRLAP